MIKTLQNTLKQDKEQFTVPKSVQDTIPIRRIWPDGIFQFGSKFSKCIRFSDINYAIASKEDKTAMFLNYSELLNALDTGSTTKITINNKRLNRQNFEKTILLPPRGDFLDGYRAEYNAMLTDKVTDSSNSVVQERYITVSTHKKNVDEARTFFDRVTNDITSRLNKLDSHSEELDAIERLRILHDFYRVGEETEFHFDLKDSMRKGASYKDAICPDSMEFKKDHFVMGDQFGRVLFLKEFASYIKDSMINELTELNRTLMLSIDVIPVPTDEAVREMQNRLLGVETNVTNWQRRQNSNNNFSAVVPYDLEQQRKETREMLDDLTTRDQRMMCAVVTLVHLADSKEELDSDTETLQSIARKHLCQLSTLNWQQAEGLVTALPLGLRRIDALRTLTTEALAVLMPFKAQEIRHQGGVYYGQNVISKNLILANRWELLNANGFVLGVSDSGKSFTAKREMVGLALAAENGAGGLPDDIIVIDPESEYRPLIEGLGGEVIEVSATSPNHINAMDMEQGYGDGENPVVLKSEFLLSLCEQLMGSGKLSAKEKSIIDRCAAQCYREYIRRGYTGAVPTLQDFHAELLRQPEPEARDVALAIELFTEGSLNTFAKPTNVDTDARILCYDIRDLGWQLLPVGMLVVLDSIFNRIIRNRQQGRNTWIYIDEIYLLFQHEYSANFLFTLWKRVRKYRACCTGITQNVDDLLQSHTARTMLANSEFLVMLNQAATDRTELARLLNISDNQLSYITNVDSGRGLIKCGSAIVPFMDNFPKNRLYRLMTTKPSDSDGGHAPGRAA
ncbi:VirB4-like conjugal transfer ATPase, CD1110 family [Flavonifractor sp. An91]|uniref:VirB4-like conjugal transfer ATPase, CD1110 family n=1 Tax=Flavonifractor sp. An91 TaxID=1965665 RepID=UPI000B3ABAA1|nr:TraE family protein [Flavonifractor sp. An91]OUN10119.1 TraE family protein [Flavonifractor sp. An91]